MLICIISEKLPVRSSTENKKLPYWWRLPYESRKKVELEYVATANLNVALHNTECKAILLSDIASIRALENLGYNLTNGTGRKRKSSFDFWGCTIRCNGKLVIVIPELNQMRINPRIAGVIYCRLINKILNPHHFAPQIELDHYIIPEAEMDSFDISVFENATLLAIDTETKPAVETMMSNGNVHIFGGVIDVFGVAALYTPASGYKIKTFTFDIKSISSFRLMYKILKTVTAKTMQNGYYDYTYFKRWGARVINYLHDTMYFMKANTPFLYINDDGMYDLQHLANLYLLISPYWKDGLDSPDRKDFHKYCATDCHNTALIAATQLKYANKITLQSFVTGFVNSPMAISSSLRGFKRNQEEFTKVALELKIESDKLKDRIKAMYGILPTQSVKLTEILNKILELFRKAGVENLPATIDGADKNMLRDISNCHPILHDLLDPIVKYRKIKQIHSTYIKRNPWHRGLNGGFGPEGKYDLFSLNPFGTDTLRANSSSSPLWVGGSFQNISGKFRKLWMPYDGYSLAASDLKAAESYTTACNTRCRKQWDVLNSGNDFHAMNGVLMLGMNYDEIVRWNAEKQEWDTIDKEGRDICKKTNHSASYLMQKKTMLRNIGLHAVLKIKKKLNLDPNMQPQDVCEFLLNGHESVYPEIRLIAPYITGKIINSTGRLLSVSGYNPVFIDHPFANKRVLNQIAAFPNQHLSAYYAMSIYRGVFLLNWKGLAVLPVIQMHDEAVMMVQASENIEHIQNEFDSISNISIDMKAKWDNGESMVLNIPSSKIKLGKTWSDVK